MDFSDKFEKGIKVKIQENTLVCMYMCVYFYLFCLICCFLEEHVSTDVVAG